VRDTGCTHPEDEVVTLPEDGIESPCWCTLCGSLRLRSGGAWIAPDGIVLPGWTCEACGVMNGSLKELLPACRSCDAPRLTADTVRDTNGGTVL
jgi:hypothetical protein